MAKKTKTRKLTVSEWFQILFPPLFFAIIGSLAESYGWISKGGTGIAIIIGCSWSYTERIRIVNNLKYK